MNLEPRTLNIELSPALLDSIDCHAFLAQHYRRLNSSRADHVYPPRVLSAHARARAAELFVSHSCIAATLAVDQQIACDVPAGMFTVVNLNAEVA